MTRPFSSRQAHSRVPLVAIAGALAIAAGQATPVWGQGPASVGELGGREFDGIRVPGVVQVTDLTIRAGRAWVWTEGGIAGDVGPSGAQGSTQRVFLQGDVKVELGQYRFTAANAVLWVQTLGPSAAKPGDADLRVRQIAIVFDRVADPGAEAGFSQAADRLLVTAATDGAIDLRADSLEPGKPLPKTAAGGFLKESEERFDRYVRGLEDPATPLGPDVKARLGLPAAQATLVPGQSRPFEPNAGFGEQPVAAEPAAPDPIEPIFAKSGIITFAVGTNSPTGATAPRFGENPGSQEYVKVIRGEEDNVVLLSGGISLQYADVRKTRNLQINAERAVVFVAPGPLTQMAQFTAGDVRGVYLEGDVVATDGQYTVRGPRVYYDFQANKAVMADAVFSTLDPKLGVPIYVRAKTLRQVAASTFEGEKARVSSSTFFTPTFAVGVSTVTVMQKDPGQRGAGGGAGDGAAAKGARETFIDAKGVTLRLWDTPFFWLPGFKGTIDEVPLSDIRVENSSGAGAAIKTAWNVFSLLGADRPKGLAVDFLLDFYFDRGWAVGTKTSWKADEHDGRLFAYTLPNDDGRDVLSTGFKKEQDQQFRGLLLAEDRWKINEHWDLFTQIALQSDPTVVDAFFKPLSEEGRELTTEAYLRRLDEKSEFTLQAKGNLNRYVPNQYLLESQGYVTDKLPEATYTRLSDDVLRGVAPGLLTWNQEYRVSRMRLNFVEPAVNEFGFLTNQRAQDAFGINPDQSLGERLRAQGFNEDDVLRWDTRQELVATFDFNPFKVMPFAVFRYTGYDRDFGELNASAPDPGDTNRAWYAAGARASTQVVRIDDSVENSLFDLHRVRHIIEPSVTAWSAGATNREENLPIYDENVEALNTGSAVRAGVTQTWQTKRGGPGRWRSVDVFKLTTDVTYSSNDVNTRSPIGRFFDARPEYSFLGNYFTSEAQWQATDVLALGASTIYDFDTHQQARTTAGGVVQHTPEFSSFAQVRYINAFDATYVDFGFNYQLTRIYSVASSFTYNTETDQLQFFTASLRRRWPDATIGVSISYNTILDETSFSAIFEPNATAAAEQARRVERLREIGR